MSIAGEGAEFYGFIGFFHVRTTRLTMRDCLLPHTHMHNYCTFL